jgi:ectoine hydroxylase
MRENLYPSRTVGPALNSPREDPVVYADPETRAPIDPALVRQYEADGFLILDQVFSGEEVQMLMEQSEMLRSDPTVQQSVETITEQGSRDVRSIFRAHETNPVYRKLAMDARLAGLAGYLLNDDVYLHQSRLNFKPGFRGKEFYWHSDFETWHVEDGMPRMRALSMSVSLTDNHEFNGPLMLIPGSHRTFIGCEGQTPEDHHEQSLKKQEYGVPSDESLGSLVKKGGIVTATGRPGSVIVFDCNVMHGSNGNITPYPRSNLFFVYNAISNRVQSPYCDRPPRPEHICTREKIEPLPVSSVVR